MIRKVSKDEIRRRIHDRIRQRVQGTPKRPRLAIFRSLKHIYCQVIDDTQGKTLAAASSVEKNSTSGGNLEGAKSVGRLIAQRAKEKGITKVVFDRGGFLYHGRVKALAEAARESGLEF